MHKHTCRSAEADAHKLAASLHCSNPTNVFRFDLQKDCKMWADRGECAHSKQYMIDHCKVACKYCTARGPRPKDAVELHPLSVAAISKEIGVTPAEAGAPPDAAAAAPEAAKQKAAADKAAADKATADKAAAAAKAATEAAAAAQAAAAKAAAAAEKAAVRAVDGPSEADMRGKYPASSLSYAALVKRCGI